MMKGMTEVRMMASEPNEHDLETLETDRLSDDGAGWRQQQLLPAPRPVSSTRPASSNGDRPSDRLRQVGLVGVAQARQALAEAARRAKARAESKAA
jgi:hypothetical protein